MTLGAVQVPTYNVLVIAASIAIAVGIGAFLQRTRFGRILRATAENREMSQALGVNVRWMYASVFTLGTILGTVGGALANRKQIEPTASGRHTYRSALCTVRLTCMATPVLTLK